MDKAFVFSTVLALQVALPLASDQVSDTVQRDVQREISGKKNVETSHIEAFTGQVAKNRVRMRLHPALDSVIINELSKDDLVVVTNENEEFYEVLPPSQMKGYVFRTYVLDGQVEGSNVNVRLEPDTGSQVVCQVNSGEKISGVVSSQNAKWLEIALPESVRFFVAKEFVNKVGDATAYHSFLGARKEFQSHLNSIENNMQEELKKSFNQVQFAPLATELQQLISKNQVYGGKVLDDAKQLLHKMQEEYLAKCMKEGESSLVAKTKCEANEEVKVVASSTGRENSGQEIVAANVPFYSANWADLERKVINDAIARNLSANEEDFLAQEQKNAISLFGIIKPYARHVKNVPGDYVLIDSKSNIPLAYLYSLKVDLRSFIGKEVAVKASERPNNNFAYPAYSVLKVE